MKLNYVPPPPPVEEPPKSTLDATKPGAKEVPQKGKPPAKK